MRKITREDELSATEKGHERKRVRMSDPSSEVFSEYLRRVYTFGCWQLVNEEVMKQSDKESHARYLETMASKWAAIQDYAQNRLILPKYDH